MKVARKAVPIQSFRPQGVRPSGSGLDYLRTLFRESPDGLCIIDRAMRVVVWNQAAAEITGYSASEALGNLCCVKGDDLKLEPFSKPLAPQRRPSLIGLVRHQKKRSGRWLNTMPTVIPLQHKNFGFLIYIPRQSPSSQEPENRSVAFSGQRSAGDEVSADRGKSDPTQSTLTRREMEILRLLATGKKPKEIARELFVSLPTIRTHVRNLHRKLGVKSSLEAVLWFLRARISKNTQFWVLQAPPDRS